MITDPAEALAAMRERAKSYVALNSQEFNASLRSAGPHVVRRRAVIREHKARIRKSITEDIDRNTLDYGIDPVTAITIAIYVIRIIAWVIRKLRQGGFLQPNEIPGEEHEEEG